MSDHTPGPWKVDNHQDSDHHVINPDSGNWIFVLHHNGEKSIVEQNANAHIIAEAPNLLKACEESLAIIVEYMDAKGSPSLEIRVAAEMLVIKLANLIKGKWRNKMAKIIKDESEREYETDILASDPDAELRLEISKDPYNGAYACWICRKCKRFLANPESHVSKAKITDSCDSCKIDKPTETKQCKECGHIYVPKKGK